MSNPLHPDPNCPVPGYITGLTHDMARLTLGQTVPSEFMSETVTDALNFLNGALIEFQDGGDEYRASCTCSTDTD